jgi:hypothetical protein
MSEIPKKMVFIEDPKPKFKIGDTVIVNGLKDSMGEQVRGAIKFVYPYSAIDGYNYSIERSDLDKKQRAVMNEGRFERIPNFRVGEIVRLTYGDDTKRELAEIKSIIGLSGDRRDIKYIIKEFESNKFPFEILETQLTKIPGPPPKFSEGQRVTLLRKKNEKGEFLTGNIDGIDLYSRSTGGWTYYVNVYADNNILKEEYKNVSIYSGHQHVREEDLELFDKPARVSKTGGYYEKYLKYKAKYMHLKEELNI